MLSLVLFLSTNVAVGTGATTAQYYRYHYSQSHIDTGWQEVVATSCDLAPLHLAQVNAVALTFDPARDTHVICACAVKGEIAENRTIRVWGQGRELGVYPSVEWASVGQVRPVGSTEGAAEGAIERDGSDTINKMATIQVATRRNVDGDMATATNVSLGLAMGSVTFSTPVTVHVFGNFTVTCAAVPDDPRALNSSSSSTHSISVPNTSIPVPNTSTQEIVINSTDDVTEEKNENQSINRQFFSRRITILFATLGACALVLALTVTAAILISRRRCARRRKQFYVERPSPPQPFPPFKPSPGLGGRHDPRKEARWDDDGQANTEESTVEQTNWRNLRREKAHTVSFYDNDVDKHKNSAKDKRNSANSVENGKNPKPAGQKRKTLSFRDTMYANFSAIMAAFGKLPAKSRDSGDRKSGGVGREVSSDGLTSYDQWRRRWSDGIKHSALDIARVPVKPVKPASGSFYAPTQNNDVTDRHPGVTDQS